MEKYILTIFALSLSMLLSLSELFIPNTGNISNVGLGVFPTFSIRAEL